MHQFQNVLLGIDVTRLEQREPATFSPPVEEAIRRGLWLAQKTGASLTFIVVLDRIEQSLAVDEQQLKASMQSTATWALEHVTERAKALGINSSTALRWGNASEEITKQVLEGKHDLVIVGTRDLRTIKRLLLGSTAMKLLRCCPCTVWVTKPGTVSPDTLNVAVATDFSVVADRALETAVFLSETTPIRIHLVNSVDYPLDRIWVGGGKLDDATKQYHGQIRAKSTTDMQHQISRVVQVKSSVSIETHVVEGMLNPDVAILQFIHDFKIDVLVIGTVGRRGMAGFFIGNTAESLLPEVTCSVIAVKPADFVSPVKVSS